MGIPLTVFLAQVDGLLAADSSELADLRRQRLIKAALERYSADAPDEYVETEVGDGGRYYKLVGTAPVLSNWVRGFSQVLAIEYPAASVASDETPVYLEPEDWDDGFETDGDVYLYLPRHTPAATESFRVRYTAPYDWTAGTVTVAVVQATHGFAPNDYVYKESTNVWYEADDVKLATHKVTAVPDAGNFTAAVLAVDPPAQDFFAICHLAAGLCCQAIAARYSRTNDSTINADSVDHRSRADMFASRAKEFIKLYERHLGLGEKGAGSRPAGEFVDWDTAPGWPSGRQFVFHGRGGR